MGSILKVLDGFREGNEIAIENNKIMNETLLLFSENIKSHLDLVNELTRESEERRLDFDPNNLSKNRRVSH